MADELLGRRRSEREEDERAALMIERGHTRDVAASKRPLELVGVAVCLERLTCDVDRLRIDLAPRALDLAAQLARDVAIVR